MSTRRLDRTVPSRSRTIRIINAAVDDNVAVVVVVIIVGVVVAAAVRVAAWSGGSRHHLTCQLTIVLYPSYEKKKYFKYILIKFIYGFVLLHIL